jgi:putative ABC transport system permease protein
MAWIERLLFRWLRAAAPDEWSESVIGDLGEDVGRSGPKRLVFLAQLGCIALRFTLEGIAHWWRNRSRSLLMTSLFHDVRYSCRFLRLNPGVSLVAVMTLGLAIGANTAIYSALSSVILRPLPFPQGDRYVFIWHRNPSMGSLMLAPPRTAVDRWRQATTVFDAVESYSTRTVVVTGAGEPEELSLTSLRETTLSMIGVSPVIGRSFTSADSAPAAPPVVLISHAFWTNRYGRDRSIVGRTLQLGTTPYSMGGDTLWAAARQGEPGADSENTLARLARGVSAAQAQAALDGMGDAGGELKGWTALVQTPGDYNGPQIKTALTVLMGAVGLLLLIACVNVANLMLAKNSARRREMAMRLALGASRWRLARLQLIECAILSAAGCAAGLAIAYGAIAAIAGLRPARLDVLEHVELDLVAMSFAAGVAVLTAVLCGLAPAVAASRAVPAAALGTSSRSATPAGHRIRGILTASQMALALMLLVGAMLLLRSYGRLTAVMPGYDPASLISVSLSLPSARYPPPARQAFFDQALTAIAAIPGVQAVAAGSGIPPQLGSNFGTLEIDGRPDNHAVSGVFAGGFVSPSFFATLGIPVLDGRVFTDDDVVGRDRVVVLGASFARQMFGSDALGRRVRLQGRDSWATVVGVVGDVKAFGLADDGRRPQIYFARAQHRPGYGAIVIRAAGDPAPLVPAIKATIWALDAQLPIRDVATADQLLTRAASQARFNMVLLTAFAGAGLLLALVGVFGVMALYVGERRREVGIRLALGATRGAVASLVLRRTALVVLGGGAAGLAAAAWLSRLTRTLLFQVSPTDFVSFLVPAGVVAVAAAAAIIVPMRRAARVDPVVVLRGD